jgi:hypothetical protein
MEIHLSTRRGGGTVASIRLPPMAEPDHPEGTEGSDGNPRE